jgi:hypothetical protein
MEYCQQLHCAYLQGLRNTPIPPVQKEPAKSEMAERAARRPRQKKSLRRSGGF